MKIKITIVMKEEEDHNCWYTVIVDDLYADKLTFEEMLGLIASLTIPKERKCLKWMKTFEERMRAHNEQKSQNNFPSKKSTFLTRLWSKS